MGKVLITGDRNWTNKSLIRSILATLPKDTVIIQGGASGADTLAKIAATELGLQVATYHAQWITYGKAAGPIRNQHMIDENPERVLAFHSNINDSKGTKDTIKRAGKAGIPVELYGDD